MPLAARMGMSADERETTTVEDGSRTGKGGRHRAASSFPMHVHRTTCCRRLVPFVLIAAIAVIAIIAVIVVVISSSNDARIRASQ